MIRDSAHISTEARYFIVILRNCKKRKRNKLLLHVSVNIKKSISKGQPSRNSKQRQENYSNHNKESYKSRAIRRTPAGELPLHLHIEVVRLESSHMVHHITYLSFQHDYPQQLLSF